MRNLILMFTLLVGLFMSAQTDRANVVTVTPFELDGVSYNHMQGSANPETNCFDGVTAGDSYDIDYRGQGQDIDLFVGGSMYRVAYNDRATVNSNISRWSYYNRIYSASGSHIENSNMLDCPDTRGWRLAVGGSSGTNTQWYVNDEFPGWAYNEYYRNGFYFAKLTDRYQGYSSSLNQRYLDNNDLGIAFGEAHSTIASLEAGIETHINFIERSTSVTWIESVQLDASGRFHTVNGASETGAHSYTITKPLQYGASVPERNGMGYYIEGSWIYHGGPNGGGSSDPNIFHRIETPTYYFYQGRELTDQDRATLGEEGIRIRLERGIITELYREPSLQQALDAQEIVRQLIRAEFDAFAAAQFPRG